MNRALDFFMKNNDIMHLKQLIKLGANININDSKQKTLLYKAIQHKKDPQTIQFLIQEGAKIRVDDRSLDCCDIVNMLDYYEDIMA